MLPSEGTETESRKTDICRLEELVPAAENVWEALRVAQRRVDQLPAELVSFTAKNEQARVELDTLTARIGHLEVAAATYNGELIVVTRAVWSLKVVL